MNKKFKYGDKVKSIKTGCILTFDIYHIKLDGSFDFSLFSVKENPGLYITNRYELLYK
jgi:hypothetical protein